MHDEYNVAGTGTPKEAESFWERAMASDGPGQYPAASQPPHLSKSPELQCAAAALENAARFYLTYCITRDQKITEIEQKIAALQEREGQARMLDNRIQEIAKHMTTANMKIDGKDPYTALAKAVKEGPDAVRAKIRHVKELPRPGLLPIGGRGAFDKAQEGLRDLLQYIFAEDGPVLPREILWEKQRLIRQRQALSPGTPIDQRSWRDMRDQARGAARLEAQKNGFAIASGVRTDEITGIDRQLQTLLRSLFGEKDTPPPAHVLNVLLFPQSVANFKDYALLPPRQEDFLAHDAPGSQSQNEVGMNPSPR